MSSNVVSVQEYLTKFGYDPGPIDGWWGPRTEAAYQRHKVAARTRHRKAAQDRGLPHDNAAELTAFYGTPAECERILVQVEFPWRALLYDGPEPWPNNAVYVHPKCKATLEVIFDEIWDLVGCDQLRLQATGMHRFFGCYVDRPKRGNSRSKSLHAYGAALDFDANNNAFRSSRAHAQMPEWVLDVFESHGWKSGGRAWGYDFMHLEQTL